MILKGLRRWFYSIRRGWRWRTSRAENYAADEPGALNTLKRVNYYERIWENRTIL